MTILRHNSGHKQAVSVIFLSERNTYLYVRIFFTNTSQFVKPKFAIESRKKCSDTLTLFVKMAFNMLRHFRMTGIH